MSKNVVKSEDKVNGTTHDLAEYAHAREVVRDFPRVIRLYNKLLPVLYEFAQYQGVWPVLQMVEDSKLLMEMQLEFYEKIHKNKGKITQG